MNSLTTNFVQRLSVSVVEYSACFSYCLVVVMMVMVMMIVLVVVAVMVLVVIFMVVVVMMVGVSVVVVMVIVVVIVVGRGGSNGFCVNMLLKSICLELKCFVYHIPVCGVACVVFVGGSGCDGGGKDISDCCGVLARNASVLLCAFVYCIHICDSIVGDDLC